MQHTYERLIVWQKSMDLVVEIYKISDNFPKSELYGLTSQMRRAAVSVPSNIAEGSRRGSKKEMQHFLRTAFGSASELETQLKLSVRLNFATIPQAEQASRLLDEVLRMLNTMTKI